MSSQFGAVCETTDYDTDVHTIGMSADYAATEKLNLNASATLSDAQAEWQKFTLTAPSIIDDPAVFTLYSFDTTRVAGYSRLEYQQAEVNLGGKYQFTTALYLAANAGVQWFIDEDPYVYGDQDGTAYSGSVGVGYKF